MSQPNAITLQQVAQKGNELNFYSQFRTRQPLNTCKTKVIGVGTSWGGFGSLYAVKSQVRQGVSLPCISTSTKRVLTSNISTNPAANGEQFLGFGYIQTAQDGNIYV
jgi:hypothetical protein